MRKNKANIVAALLIVPMALALAITPAAPTGMTPQVPQPDAGNLASSDSHSSSIADSPVMADAFSISNELLNLPLAEAEQRIRNLMATYRPDLLSGATLFADQHDVDDLLASDLPLLTADAANPGASARVFAAANSLSGSTRLQQSQGLPMFGGGTWTGPDKELDIEGAPDPTDDEIRDVIGKNIDWMLSEQNEDGSWDVELAGAILSQTADHAIDIITSTAMAGIALRKHIKYNPEAITPALSRALDYIMDRVLRGQLPTKVYYACWRYELGLRYLMVEYENTPTSESDRRDLMQSVARRMVQSLLNMQMINGRKFRIDRMGKPNVKGKPEDLAPASTGIVCELPTDEDFKGGAKVKHVPESSDLFKRGMRPGDRIYMMERVRIENAFDFYSVEETLLETQEVNVSFKREIGEGKVNTTHVKFRIESYWPGGPGFTVKEGGAGVEVEAFTRGSNARDVIERGTTITKVERTDVKSVEDFNTAIKELNLKPGDKFKVSAEVTKNGRSSSKGISIKASKRSPGQSWMEPYEESKDISSGVKIAEVYQAREGQDKLPAEAAGLTKDDHITAIDGVEILGFDHYRAIESRFYAGQEVVFTRSRPYVDPENVTVVMDEQLMLGTLGFDPELSQKKVQKHGMRTMVKKVHEKGPAAKAGLKPGDFINAIDGQAAFGNIVWFYYIFMNWFCLEGEEFVVTVESNGTERNVTMVAAPPNSDVVPGGWNYYPDQAVATSFTTSAIVVTFHNLRSKMGITVPRGAMNAAINSIEGMRMDDVPNNKKTFVYDERFIEEPEDEEEKAFMMTTRDIKGTIGRIMACSYALQQSNQRISTADMRRNMLDFWANRKWIDRVRRYPHTHYQREYQNAAYYWFYGHYFALLAAKEVKDNDSIKKIIKATMLRNKDFEGLFETGPHWLGHEGFGPHIGTCQALWILGDGGDWFKNKAETTQGAGAK